MNSTVLLGHDGWADARYGDFDHSSVTLNDSRLIAELFQAFLLISQHLKMKCKNWLTQMHSLSKKHLQMR